MQGELNMATIIAAAAVVAILFFAIRHIVRAKKRGAHCIGCPQAGACCKTYSEMKAEIRKDTEQCCSK